MSVSAVLKRYGQQYLDRFGPTMTAQQKKVLRADEKARDLEYSLFGVLREKTAEHIPGLQSSASALAEIDALASLAEVAADLRSDISIVNERIIDSDSAERVELRLTSRRGKYSQASPFSQNSRRHSHGRCAASNQDGLVCDHQP